ncbi:phosphotransferase family protein [Terribacillus saccharophilus]|uniref:phosphotransferase family protein n=1 Tax=Terribacillus saccharophilus TaxID=361277 RepID=UPI00398252F9
MDKTWAEWLEGYVQEPIRSVETIDTGWDHDVYVLNDSWVLRVPKKGAAINQDEKKLLRALQVKTNIALPAPTICTTPEGNEAMLYPYIPGQPISANMSDVILETAANQLGAFLSKLHQLDASSYALLKRDSTYYDLLLDRVRCFYPDLSDSAIYHTERLFHELQPICTAFVHGDLRSEHILWEESTCQVGIIDFSDMHVGDPAIDFVGIGQISTDFLNRVLCNYDAAGKEAILQRANQLAKLRPYFKLLEYGPGSNLAAEIERQYI